MQGINAFMYVYMCRMSYERDFFGHKVSHLNQSQLALSRPQVLFKHFLFLTQVSKSLSEKVTVCTLAWHLT